MKGTTYERVIGAARDVLPTTIKTCVWLVKITVLISFGILVLRYFDILPWFSGLISPVFNIFGLPGEAALAYVTGYFVNVYSAIAVISTLDLDIRAITILSVMVLCSHNIIIETAVQKKTGSSAIRMVVIRTLSALILAFVLNKIMPGEVVSNVLNSAVEKASLKEMLTDWLYSTIRIVITMTILIFTLSILQKILSEFGVIRWISKFLRPLLAIFGLPAKTSFLWIVANTLGLAYGAAVMIEEYEGGKVNKSDIDLLNHHIAISHSNLEDVILLTSVGGMFWWLLLSRWAMSLLLVWELKAEMAIRKKILTFVG